MLTSYWVRCPHDGCNWSGSLLPRTDAEAWHGATPPPAEVVFECPRCHGDKFEIDRVTEATVEEVSVMHHMLGQENWQPRRIASVRTSDGQRITVGLRDDAGPGATIELFQEEQAPFGRTKK